MSSISPTSPSLLFSGSPNNTALPSVLFTTNPNATDTNKSFQLNAHSYDYCAFSYDFGYNDYPLTPFVASSFYLVNGTPGALLVNGDYTIGATSGMYVYGGSGSGSGITTGGTSTGGTRCTGLTYPTMTGGTITITGGLPTTVTGYRNVNGVTGTFNVTLSTGATITGTFGAGLCSAVNSTPPASAGVCACST